MNRQLETHAILDCLRVMEQSELKYDMLSDAIYWSDEIPIDSYDRPELYGFLKSVLRYRTTLIVDSPDDDLRSAWLEAKAAFPNWPGFALERCQPNEALKQQFEEFHARAVHAFRSIPD